MKSDQKHLEKAYKRSFWSKLPDHLSINETVSKAVRGEFTVSLKHGIYYINDVSNECFIRRISGTREKIMMLIKNEQGVIDLLCNDQLFDTDYGFCLSGSKNNENKYKYTHVYKRYNLCFNDFKIFNEVIQEKLIKKLFDAMIFLNRHNYYHGYITPSNIHIDEFLNLKLGNLICSGRWRKQDFNDLKDRLLLIDTGFVSPEAYIAIKCIHDNYEVVSFDPLKSDWFSFAYSILSVITGYTKLNELNVNLAGCQYKIINKSHANLEKLDEYVTSDFMESLVGEIIRIDNIKKKILNPLPNSDIKIIFRSMLKIYINERMNFSDCYKKILIFRHDQFSSYKKTNKSICINPELNKIFMQFS